MTTVYPTHWHLDRTVLGVYHLNIYYGIQIDEEGLEQYLTTNSMDTFDSLEDALEAISVLEDKIRQTN